MAALALLVPGITAPATPARPPLHPKSQAVDFARPEIARTPPDLLLKTEDARKADALTAFAEGILAEQNADEDKALEAYRKVLNIDPGYSELATKVALELLRRKSYDQAVNVLKDQIKAAKNREPGVRLMVAQIYSKYLNKPEPAIRYANEALEIDPNSVLAYLTLFEAQINQCLSSRLANPANSPGPVVRQTGSDNRSSGPDKRPSGSDRQSGSDLKKAEQVLERVSKLNIKEPQFWLQVAEIYGRLVLNGTAQNPGELEKLNTLYRKALSFDPDNAEVQLSVADFYRQSRQYNEAIPLYEAIAKHLQNNPDAMLATVQDQLAVIYRLAGQTPKAIETLKQIIKQNPLRYESYLILAGIYEDEGDLENALANYQQMLLMRPDDLKNYLRVADMHLKLKTASKAVEVLSEARARFPEAPQITYSLAIALSQAQRFQQALTVFSECYHDAKTSKPDMLNPAFYFAYGTTAEQADNLELAEVMLKRSIEADPAESAQACNYLGYLWIERGIRLDEAGKLIEQALALDPGNAAFQDSLGWYYFKKGEYAKALEELKKAAANLQPEDPVVYEHLGDTYFNLGNTQEALVYWGKALVLDENRKGLKEKIEAAGK